jgi:AraC-like DNA-binding protein
MIRFSYHLKDFRHWLVDLATLLDVPASGGKLMLPEQLGHGYILAGRLPEGLSFAIMDFTLSEDIAFVQEACPCRSLYLVFNSAPTLFSTAALREQVIAKDTPVRSVCIFFPEPFLVRHVRKDILHGLFCYTDNHPVRSAKDLVPFEYRPVLEDIFAADPGSPLLHLTLHNRILLLVEHFLESFLTKGVFSMPGGKFWVKSKEKDLEALKGIIRILSDSQIGKFPSIDALSKTAMMSSTKLKSRFKQIYGMKLYEFYNRNRLGQAREMLKTGNYSVKQVGTNIGFSNLSNFAKAFRKEFGVLPREVLRK